MQKAISTRHAMLIAPIRTVTIILNISSLYAVSWVTDKDIWYDCGVAESTLIPT